MTGVALFLSPQPRDPKDGVIFSAAIATDREATGEVVDTANALPPDWQGQFKAHLLPIEMLNGTTHVPEGITHLALLESTFATNDPFRFGPKPITHNSMVVWKAEDGTYRYFHCERCASAVLVWLSQEQETWERPLN